MRKAYLLLFCLCFTTFLFAQKNSSVKGVAFDTATKQPVAAATITVLQKKDSSLVTFTMTGNDGSFNLKGLPDGDYRLMITHVNYHSIYKSFTISDNNKNIEFETLAMTNKTKVLDEVTVTGEAPPVTLLDDTVQYNAGSFKVQPNANVEQLLKKLPGVKVDKDGTIKAQGEKVTKVLVDGKEFFGNDPKVATKNLPADAVDKVQVYDKQSDQAQLTGFEDGNYEKTINLKLKDDKKHGAFGKINAGAGTDGRYEGKFNINSFKGARQVSAIGMGNNTNAEGFSFMDILNFTGELAKMQKGGGNMSINLSSDNAAAMGLNPGGTNSGINTACAGGINYNNIIGKNLDLQSNYFYNRFNPNTESNIQRQYFLPDSSYFYNQHSFANNLNNSHRFNLNALYQIDSFNSLRITPSFTYQKTNNSSQTNYQTLSGNKALTNNGFSNTSTYNEGFNFGSTVIWRKKFALKGRTFSLSLQTSLNNSNGGGNIFSINNFYTPDSSLIAMDTLNQQNFTHANLQGYIAKAIYTEPVFKKSLLEFSVSKSSSRSTAEKITNDYNKLDGKFNLKNDSLSNDFENTYGYYTGGIRFRTQKKNYNFAFGFSYQQAQLEGTIITGVKDSVISKTFRNFLPNARFQYNFSKFKTLAINYAASTNQPTVSQLQPVPDNSNPLNIKIGNPNLKQELNHNIMGHLNLISPYKNKNLFIFFTMQFTENKIVNADSVDVLGINRTKPVNVNGVYNINSEISYSMPLHFLKGTVELSGNASLLKTKQFINESVNDIKTLSLGPRLRFDVNPTDKINIGLSANINYYNTKNSLQPALNTNYVSQNYDASFDWEMPKRFFFSTDFNYMINSQRTAGYNINVPLWNMSISKQMLKFNRGELKLSVRDLLNKNIGNSRNTNNNYIEDSRVMTLRRFFLLSFTYSLTKTGLNNAGGGGGMRMIIK